MNGRMSAGLLALGSVVMCGAAACAGVTGITHPSPAPVVQTSPPERPLPNGVLIGLAGGSVPRFEAATGARLALNVSYVSMSQPLSGAYIRWVAKRAEGARPVIDVLPYGISLRSLVKGNSDSWLNGLRKQINRPVVLSFGPEADGTWYSWSSNPALYRQAWQHVVHVIGHHDVTWMWQQSARPGMPARKLLAYWPGPGFVDWIGLDGYINRPGISFGARFGKAISQLHRTGKPILLAETSVGPGADRVGHDILSLFAGIKNDHLLGLIWFDRFKGHGLNWNLEGRPGALAAFRIALAQLTLVNHKP